MDDITLALLFMENRTLPDLAALASIERDELERRLKRIGCEWSPVEERLRERGQLEPLQTLPAGRTGEMYRYYQDGHSIEEVGAHFKLSKQRVSQIFQKANLKLRASPHMPKRVHLDPVKVRRKYYTEGLPMHAVATYFKTSVKTLTEFMDKHNIERRGAGRRRKEEAEKN